MSGHSGNKKVPKGLVALSSAAVIAVYGAGYARTRAAAEKFEQQANERRPRIPADRSDTREPIAPLAPPSASASNAVATPVAREERPEPPARVTVDAAAPVTPKAAAKDTRSAPAVVEPAPPVDAPAASQVAEAAGSETAATPTPAQAPAPAPAPPPVPAALAAAFKDGTYYGWGSCRHGDIQAAVTIELGKIVEARVERCLTRYSCNWVTPIFPRIVAKQGTTYDYVSGATESSDAFQDAVAEALRQAKP